MTPTQTHADAPALLLPFPGTQSAAIGDVGGKAHSLIRLGAAGLPVPSGVVLTTAFFSPWIEQVLRSQAWRTVRESPPGQWPQACAALKHFAAELSLDAAQAEALTQLNVQLARVGARGLFAVRSSSPQEDLQGTSFAGGYQSCLGITAAGIEAAVRSCFASLFDERVFAYKAARGLSLEAPAFAVVVQQQIASDVAGVAFSLNPINNDYDQAVIDGNWGQGETVVAGEVTPDHWVLDKVTGRLLEEAIHDKRHSRWLLPDGGLEDRVDARASLPCLTPAQRDQLLAVIVRIEALFQHPVDIEWAFAGDTLHLLQARPVTAFVPLPAAMITAPGQRRRLYMDIALSSGLTINAPISPMSLGVFGRVFADMARMALGPTLPRTGPEDALVLMDGGRMYMDFSNVLWLSKPGAMAAKMEMSDARLARILAAMDPREYRSEQRPAWARLRMLWRMPAALWRLRRVPGNLIFAYLAPARVQARLARGMADYERQLADDIADALSLPLADYLQQQVTAKLPMMFALSVPGMGAGVSAVQAFARLARPLVGEDAALADSLDRGFEGNVVVAMSLAMHRLSARLSPADRRAPEQLAARLARAELPEDFMADWREFLANFGCRGPMEMDIASPRYADDPVIALRQIAAMPSAGPGSDPQAAVQQQIERRRAAMATVIARAGPIRRWLLHRLREVIERFAGLRDTPKHHLLLVLHGLRRRLVAEGEQLHRSGRLDQPGQVFELDLEELLAAASDPSLDLRAKAAARRDHYAMLASQVVNFPALIDSRGRILRPPVVPRAPGEFGGLGLSPGIARGPARTLRSPHDGPLREGEVLIAYTTDPGWTPIFANASAVVLEIGGALQHGAVVARELGLPCVAGIDGITTAIEDGQWLEVDGASGVVRRVSGPA